MQRFAGKIFRTDLTDPRDTSGFKIEFAFVTFDLKLFRPVLDAFSMAFSSVTKIEDLFFSFKKEE